MSATLAATRVITNEDIDNCARLTGDAGSHHIDGFRGRRMAQGILTLSAVPLLGSPGVHIQELSVTFLAPVYAAQAVTATMTVTGADDLPGGLVRLRCQIDAVDSDGTTVMTGSGVAELSREQASSQLTACRTELL